MGDFKKLDVWQAARLLACDVYRDTGAFPKIRGLLAYQSTSSLIRFHRSKHR